MGTKATAKKHRQRLRKKLAAEGYSAEYIDAAVAERRESHRMAALDTRLAARRARQAAEDEERRAADAAAAAAQRQQWEDETYARLNLDDRRHRPSSPDPLTTGSARVTPATAKAARRTKATTKHELEQQETR